MSNSALKSKTFGLPSGFRANDDATRRRRLQKLKSLTINLLIIIIMTILKMLINQKE